MSDKDNFGHIERRISNERAQRLNDYRDTVERLEAELAAIKEQQGWRPISEAHEDHGYCVFISVHDLDRRVVSHANRLDYAQEVTGMTHFAELPPLSVDDVANLTFFLEVK